MIKYNELLLLFFFLYNGVCLWIHVVRLYCYVFYYLLVHRTISLCICHSYQKLFPEVQKNVL